MTAAQNDRAVAPLLCDADGHVAAECRACVAAAFADGRLSLVVDDAMPLGRALGGRGWNFAGDAKADSADIARVVHVMSKPAGGEIRGYVLIDGALRQRGPCYAGPWPVLDAEVLKRVPGASRVIAIGGDQ